MDTNVRHKISNELIYKGPSAMLFHKYWELKVVTMSIIYQIY